jgi:hypothetical protein
MATSPAPSPSATAWVAERDAPRKPDKAPSAEELAERTRVHRALAKARLGLARTTRGIAALRAFRARYAHDAVCDASVAGAGVDATANDNRTVNDGGNVDPTATDDE